MKNENGAFLIAACIVAALALLIGQLAPVQVLGWRLYDFGLKQRKSAFFDDVVLVGITNDDVSWLGKPFPWPRNEQAVIYEKIAAQSPRAVTVDFLYTEASRDEDDLELARTLGLTDKAVGAFYFDPGKDSPRSPSDEAALAASGNVLGASVKNRRWIKPKGRPRVPTPKVLTGFARIGNAMSNVDDDGITRRLPLLMSDGQRLYPSLAFQTVLLYWGVDWSQVRASPREITIVNVPEIGDIKIPLDGRGRFLPPFPTDTDNQFNGVSVKQLMHDEVPPMKDKLVVVGSLLTGHGDVYPTPVAAATAGLMINGVVAGTILRRDFITPLGFWISALATALSVGVTIAFFSKRRPVVSLFLGLLLVAGVFALCFWLLAGFSIWISPVSPAAGCVMTSIGLTAWNLAALDRRRRETRRMLSRYLSPALAESLAGDAAALTRPPRRKVLSVFFSDIVAYTDMSERLEAEDLISYLNQYYAKMTEAAHRREGTVNKYLGDGMMVFFNDPFEQEDHPARSVRMALDMQEALDELNLAYERQGLPPVEVRMGVSTGYATVGNLGSEGFTDYTAIGPTVNLAARIMNLAGGGEIYVSERTMLALPPGEFESEELGSFSLKGVSEKEKVSSIKRGGALNGR